MCIYDVWVKHNVSKSKCGVFEMWLARVYTAISQGLFQILTWDVEAKRSKQLKVLDGAQQQEFRIKLNHPESMSLAKQNEN